MKIKIAIASSDGRQIDLHFGKAELFRIYELGEDHKFREVEVRTVAPGCVDCGNHQDARIRNVVEHLSDCRSVVASKIGREARVALETAGINAFDQQFSVAAVLTPLERFYGRQAKLAAGAPEQEEE